MLNRTISNLLVGFAAGVLLATGIFSVLSSDRGGHSKVLKLAHVLDQAHPVHTAMVYMAERLAENSNGALTIDIFPNGQLGGETDTIEQLQRGVIAMVKTSTAPLEAFVPEMAIFGIPYLFRDEEHFWNVLNGPIGEELLDLPTPHGMKGLIYYEAGSRSFYTVGKPILTPDDLVGMKIRVMKSRLAMDMISQMGGAPTPITFAELYTALQQGMVDGAENNPPSFDSNRHYEVAKHYSLDEHTRIPDLVIISTSVWDSLTNQEREWLKSAADDSVVFQRELWKEKVLKSLETAKEAGVTIHYPDKAPFREKVAPILESFNGTAVGELAKRIQEVE